MKIRQALKLYGRSKRTLTVFRNSHDYDFVIGGNRILYRSRYDLKNRWYIPFRNQRAKTRLTHYLRRNKNVVYLVEQKGFDIVAQIRSVDVFLDNLPEIGKTYSAYDDGKIRPSREFSVTISRIIPHESAEPEIIEKWKKEIETIHWLFSDTTDYFIEDTDHDIYARTNRGEWYGITINALLDTDEAG